MPTQLRMVSFARQRASCPTLNSQIIPHACPLRANVKAPHAKAQGTQRDSRNHIEAGTTAFKAERRRGKNDKDDSIVTPVKDANGKQWWGGGYDDAGGVGAWKGEGLGGYDATL